MKKIIKKIVNLIRKLGSDVGLMKGIIFLVILGREVYLETSSELKGIEILLGGVFLMMDFNDHEDIA
jgi:hypothetical protein